MQSYNKKLLNHSVRALVFGLLSFFISSQMSFANSVQNKPKNIQDDIGVYMDSTMQALMTTSDIPAATVSVVKNGELIFSKGYGVSNIEKGTPVDSQTSLFRIGSTSKLFTWTSVMQLYEKGLLDLNADVNIYLKNFQLPDTYEQPITLTHILTHTAGFEDGGLGYLIKYDQETTLPLAEAMKKFLPARINPPGKYSSYSNYATALAGLIVQNVSGMPFNSYVKQNIFQPLGMHHSTFEEPLPADLVADMTQGYTREMGVFAAQPFELITSFAPAGSVSSSADDMAKFMLAHLNNGELNGKRILKAETAKLMHSVLFVPHDGLVGMAHGFYEHDINGHRLIGHGGDTMQFHTDMVLDKDEGLGIFISIMNTVDNKARNVFVQSFYDYFYPQAIKPIAVPTDFDQRAAQYAGEYQFWRNNESSIEKFVKVLSPAIAVVPTGKGTLFVSGPFAPRQFVEVGKDLFRQVDGKELLAFGANEKGEIVDLYFNSLPFMALGRVSLFESSMFKLYLPILTILLFLQVIIGWLYKRREYKSEVQEQQRLIYLSLGTSVVNVLFILFLTLIIAVYQVTLYEEIPFVFGLNLILPIIATILSFVSLYALVKRWSVGNWTWGGKLYWGLVTAAGLYMSFYYYYWNILGWNYF